MGTKGQSDALLVNEMMTWRGEKRGGRDTGVKGRK